MTICKKEANVLFNDALDTFYLWLYGIGHTEKHNSDKTRANPLLPLHGLHFAISSKVSFICTITINSIAQIITMTGTRKWNNGFTHMGSIRRPIAPLVVTIYALSVAFSYIRLLFFSPSVLSKNIQTIPATYFHARILKYCALWKVESDIEWKVT